MRTASIAVLPPPKTATFLPLQSNTGVSLLFFCASALLSLVFGSTDVAVGVQVDVTDAAAVRAAVDVQTTDLMWSVHRAGGGQGRVDELALKRDDVLKDRTVVLGQSFGGATAVTLAVKAV